MSDRLTLTLGSAPENGSVWVNDDGTVTYTPKRGFSGTDRFTYSVSDGKGGTSTATVTVSVKAEAIAPNREPEANSDRVTTEYQTAVTIDVLGNDSDPDGDRLSVSIETQPRNGSVVVNDDGRAIYRPNAKFFGTDRFTYAISDGKGGTATATVTVTVKKRPNNPPVANKDEATTSYGRSVSINVLSNDTDPDGDQVEITSVTQGNQGSVKNNGDGTITYQPPIGFLGTDTFTYTISDGQGETATATVTVPITNPQYQTSG